MPNNNNNNNNNNVASPARAQDSASLGSTLKSMSAFFGRKLLLLPVVGSQAHPQVEKRAGLRAVTLELDTSSRPEIEYIAGNRLAVYPVARPELVSSVTSRLRNDLQGAQAPPGAMWAAPLAELGAERGLAVCLGYIYDLHAAPSRDLLRALAQFNARPKERARMHQLASDQTIWEAWACSQVRSLKWVLCDEFQGCELVSARVLLNHLAEQQPRLYSISSIKSNQRFRLELIVLEHRFGPKQVRERLSSAKRAMAAARPDPGPNQASPAAAAEERDLSRRSLRSLAALSTPFVGEPMSSPISSQQVRRVPSHSGPVMSAYASASLADPAGGPQTPPDPGPQQGSREHSSQSRLAGPQPARRPHAASSGSHSAGAGSGAGANLSPSAGRLPAAGACSSYLLGLAAGDRILCELVENPRFTLKGNRGRPVMMIGQDVGVLGFRSFWQQRALEQERARVFYQLFSDLVPKQFGDMRLVCVTGHPARLEALFGRELRRAQSNKVLSSVSHVSASQLLALLEQVNPAGEGASEGASSASTSSTGTQGSQPLLPRVRLESAELRELGDAIYKLLAESNGCLYTCCDQQVTQALELLLIECGAKRGGPGARRRIVRTRLPAWKGRVAAAAAAAAAMAPAGSPASSAGHNLPALSNRQLLYKLENPFERAQIVQEVYESSV